MDDVNTISNDANRTHHERATLNNCTAHILNKKKEIVLIIKDADEKKI